MARIIGIDYGTKKVGLAVTDPLQLIVSGLATVARSDLDAFIDDYMSSEAVEEVVLGIPHHPDGNRAQLADEITNYGKKLTHKYPDVSISFQDESYSSREARQIILKSGARKKKRRDKSLVDKISAVLILQTYLKHI